MIAASMSYGLVLEQRVWRESVFLMAVVGGGKVCGRTVIDFGQRERS